MTCACTRKGSHQNLKMCNCASFFKLMNWSVCKRLRLLCHFVVLILNAYLTTLCKSVFIVFVRKPEGKPPLRRPKSGWGSNIKVSLIKIDQLEALLFHYLMLNVFRMLIHPSSGACGLFVELFHGLYCSGSMCVGVTAWFGWDGVVSLCRLKPA